MPSETASSRRHFQFRLRTLMIGVTLFCVAVGDHVGRQASIMRERRAELIRGVPGRLCSLDGELDASVIPWIRRALGDKLVRAILYPVGTDATELDRLRVLFPEAIVTVYTSTDSSVR